MTPATAERHLHGCTYDNIVATTGNTPLVRLNRVIPTGHATVLGKCEFFNPLSSVKDRIGRSMIETGERDGLVNADTHIIEPTSGNTGIALAFVCAGKGYTLTLTMPESMSMERRGLLRALGANVVLTPADQGMKGAIEKAAELVATTGNAWMPQQFENPANPAIHEATTGPEIWDDTQGQADVLVAGVGTGGTITGVGRFIKPRKPTFACIAVEPQDSPVITQTLDGDAVKPGPHKIQGIGAGFVPKNLQLDLVDEVQHVDNDESFAMARRLAGEEGLFCGISSGANVAAAARVAAIPQNKDKTIVVILPSIGERYMSTPLFQEYMH
ncbi:MAG: cysteine synthase A [Phycisphaeraceae bacterium]|jgi:cysteine synthase A|nr:cysteine synthase A [Phycisphaeraceae bacterium]